MVYSKLFKEILISSANEMKHEASGTQQLRHINKIGEGVSTAQRSDSLMQPINQRFLKFLGFICLGLRFPAFPLWLRQGSFPQQLSHQKKSALVYLRLYFHDLT